MAMSRSFGDSSLTTRPPIETVPPEMSSSPATIRSAVVLPQPDGPTSTRNSPSPMSSERSKTAWTPLSYSLSTSLKTTSAIDQPPRIERRSVCRENDVAVLRDRVRAEQRLELTACERGEGKPHGKVLAPRGQAEDALGIGLAQVGDRIL